jgi:hypothetical protein
VPKDDYAKARRGDIARRATAQQGFEQRERQRDNAKRQLAAMGSGDAFYEALVMMRRKMA